MGFLRLALALAIIRGHSTELGGHWTGALMVAGFYAIAGYFATYAMQHGYKGQWATFLVSRWFRLWPIYLVIFLGSVAGLAALNPLRLGLISAHELVRQSLMILPDHDHHLLWVVGPGWMLKYLLLGYLAIALGAAASARRTWAWLALSFAMVEVARIHSLYWPGATASLAFAVGASAFWAGLSVPRDGRWGAWAGALSYPVFLSHWQIDRALRIATEIPLGWPLFFAVLALSLPLSAVLVLAVDRPADRFRKSLLTKG